MSVETIIADLIKAEGGLVNDPADAGGITNHGITKATLEEYLGHTVTDQEIANLTDDDAAAIYTHLFVEKTRFGEITDPVLQELVVDCAVLHGRPTAARWLQQAVGVAVDGLVGPGTLATVNAARPLQVYLRICAIRWRAIAAIVVEKPSQITFLEGWCNRGSHFLDQVSTT